MDIRDLFVLLLTIAMILFALLVKPIRKTIGLLLVILGTLAGLTFVGLVIGIPIIIIGGLLLFV